MSATDPVWTGGFVAQALDVHIHSDPSSTIAVKDLVGLALRRNPKRAHLLVSTVLAKHVPTEPALVMAAGGLLGALVAQQLSSSAHDADTRRWSACSSSSPRTYVSCRVSTATCRWRRPGSRAWRGAGARGCSTLPSS